MVERVLLAVGVFVATLGVLYGVPRAIGNGSSQYGTTPWPDLLRSIESAQNRWLTLPGFADLIAAIITIAVLMAGLSIFLDPTIIGVTGSVFEGIGLVLIVIGLLLLGGVTSLRVRRGGVSAAEAVLIGAMLAGAVLSILILFVLSQ